MWGGCKVLTLGLLLWCWLPTLWSYHNTYHYTLHYHKNKIIAVQGSQCTWFLCCKQSLWKQWQMRFCMWQRYIIYWVNWKGIFLDVFDHIVMLFSNMKNKQIFSHWSARKQKDHVHDICHIKPSWSKFWTWHSLHRDQSQGNRDKSSTTKKLVILLMWIMK